MRYSRLVTIGALGAACMLVACQDGLLRPAAPRAASLSMVVTLERAVGGAPEAFDRANGAVIRFSAGGDVRREETLPFSSAGTETVLRVDIPLRQLSEEMTVDLELQSGGRPLFRGSTNATFTSGVTSTVRFTLAPVVASVSCAGPTLQFATYGRSQLLSAAALFATGDTVLGAPITWSVSDGRIASVTPTGLVSAIADGDASVTCASGDVSTSRPVKVFAVVNQVELARGTVTLRVGDTVALRVGETVTLTPTLSDSDGHVITTARPISWSSSDTAAASVNNGGLVTGVGPGSARITAASGTASAVATVRVADVPTVLTSPATNVTASGASLNGSVNPNGSVTQAWFEYGTSSTLASFNQTTAQPVASGTSLTPVAASIGNLQPITTYYFRLVASNGAGSAQGNILSFKTGGAPPQLANTNGSYSSVCGLQSCTYYTSMSTTVNPNGLPTNVWFEYSFDSTFTRFSSTAQQSAGSGTSFVAASASVNTGYYYFRAVAQNALGIVRSAVVSPPSPIL